MTRSRSKKVICAEVIQLIDSAGRTRARVQTDELTGAAIFQILDERATSRLTAECTSSGRIAAGLSDSEGTTRIGMSVDDSGSGIGFFDNHGTTALTISIDVSGDVLVQFYNKSGERMQLWKVTR